MHLPSAHTVSPNFATLLTEYQALKPSYERASIEEDRLNRIYEQDKPRAKNKAVAFRAELGVERAVAEADRLSDQLSDIAFRIYDAEPARWPDLEVIANLVRQRNGTEEGGATVGVTAEIPDFARIIERLGEAQAQAEAADAALIDLVARYEALHVDDESRSARESGFEPAFDALFDTIADWCPKTLYGLAAMAKVSRLRDNDTLRDTVLGHVERLGGLPVATMPAVNSGPAFETLENIARDAQKAHLRVGELQGAHSRAEMAGRPLAAKALWEEAESAIRDIGLTFDRGLDIPARSLTDVLAGLVAIALNVSEFAHHHDDPETEARMEAIEEKVQRRLYGLRGFVERLAGMSSDELGGAYCLSSALDPFTSGQPLALRREDRATAGKTDAA